MNLETQMTAYDFGTPEEVVRPASCLTISHHVWICEGVTILPQVTYIAPHVVIGARAVVTRNLVEEWGMYAGSPARLIKRHKYD
jgi:acetyltransferase-like isoleucine patch superfamily enzyme